MPGRTQQSDFTKHSACYVKFPEGRGGQSFGPERAANDSGLAKNVRREAAERRRAVAGLGSVAAAHDGAVGEQEE